IPARVTVAPEPHVVASTRLYLAGVAEYLRCMRAELEAVRGEAAPELLRSVIARRTRAAIVEAAAIVSLFNERGADSDELRIEDLLAAEGLVCLDTKAIRDTAVLHDRVALFTASDGSTYLNPLRRSCGRLEGLAVVVFGRGRVCKGDFVFALPAENVQR